MRGLRKVVRGCERFRGVVGCVKGGRCEGVRNLGWVVNSCESCGMLKKAVEGCEML